MVRSDRGYIDDGALRFLEMRNGEFREAKNPEKIALYLYQKNNVKRLTV